MPWFFGITKNAELKGQQYTISQRWTGKKTVEIFVGYCPRRHVL